MSLSDRLTIAMSRAGITQAELARLCGVKPPSVNGWLSGKSKFLRGENLLQAANALKVNQQWLATGEGPMSNPSSHSNLEPGPNLRGKVPLVSWVQAGAWCEAVYTTHVTEAERWMDCPVAHSSQTFALRVRGDSMTAPSGAARTYPEGCFIFVDPERKNPVNGDRVVACLLDANEVTFKVYKNEDGRQWLQPLNPTHEPIREPFRVLGTVLGKWEDG
ncbi:LexA family protein [Comamonas aquatica]|jgi:SOS-response transcriptional repressor LexA|uniref:LexA family protein n=1 Tax=Comamonas aquatica TaxID=225991 RepID=UPI00244C8D8D|nr:XRE family transcriptional regulator [Comamonas aquatica]MDH0494118.1 XRE family transcriptional regulator [Comamonas aquatica]